MVSSLLWTTTQTSSKLEKICEQPDKAKCEMNLNVERVICSSNLLHYKNYKNAKIVYMCSWLDSFMNPEEILSDFPLVKKLAITQGNITEFLTDFPRSVHLQHLILTDLNIGQLKSTLFFSLEKLEFLDLSRNNLKRLSEEAIKNPPSLSKIILTGKIRFSFECNHKLSTESMNFVNELQFNLEKVCHTFKSKKAFKLHFVKLLLFTLQLFAGRSICAFLK